MVSQTKVKKRSSRRYTYPTLAQTSRENGAPTVWKSETKSTTGKRTGHPRLDAKQLLSDLFGRCVCS